MKTYFQAIYYNIKPSISFMIIYCLQNHGNSGNFRAEKFLGYIECSCILTSFNYILCVLKIFRVCNFRTLRRRRKFLNNENLPNYGTILLSRPFRNLCYIVYLINWTFHAYSYTHMTVVCMNCSFCYITFPACVLLSKNLYSTCSCLCKCLFAFLLSRIVKNFCWCKISRNRLSTLQRKLSWF